MPKPRTFPCLYDECKTLSIAFLKENGYLSPGSFKGGIVYWSRNGKRYSSIRIAVNLAVERPYLELDYKHNGELIRYKVYLVSVPSNINKGKIWHFSCPMTGKRCQKLYMVKTYFLHRSAFKGAMYEKQTYSKVLRQQIKTWEQLFCIEKNYVQIYRKHFKKYYSGKPTKMYSKLLREIAEYKGL